VTPVVYLNGRFVAPSDAVVSLFDHGYLFGDGFFETLRAYDGTWFRLDAHLDRLFDAARFLLIAMPTSRSDLARLAYAALERSGLRDAYLRITVSRGVGERGIDPALCPSPTLSLIVKEVPLYPAAWYDSGIPTRIVSVRRIAEDALSARIKGCNYQNLILAKLEANQHGAPEGLLLNAEGFLAEGTVSNVFIARRGELLTPTPTCGCLEGITRGAVIELARQNRSGVRETRISRYDLYTADECFLTSSLMELLPVVDVDGRAIGDGKPGEVTRRLHRLYRELTRSERREP
jgi:branched-chain amino acid aminotransferase